jgi:integrase
VDFFLHHMEAVARSIPLSRAVNELIENRKATGASNRYCNDLRLRLSRFVNDYPNLMVAEVSTKAVDDWLAGLSLAPVTRNTFRRDLRTLFSFCVTRRYATENPVTKTRRAKEVDNTVGILTPNDMSRLLSVADETTIPYWTIGAFAGLRRAEIERLDWSDIDLDANLIDIKARNSKTATRRLVTIQPNLQAWLAPHRKVAGSVCPSTLRIKLDADRARCGLLQNWPQNGLRHSFGSYHLARFNDAAALALQMGNSPAMIFKHYRQLVKPKAAQEYWNITPLPSSDERVVQFAAVHGSTAPSPMHPGPWKTRHRGCR